MDKLPKERVINNNLGDFRFIKVNGSMTKVYINAAESAFEAAMEAHYQRKNNTENKKDAFINDPCR